MQRDKVIYNEPQRENWTGRDVDLSLPPQYWYQAITLIDAENQDYKDTDVALLGYACEEGVRRNLGRVGAKDAPKFIRERLAKVALHHKKKVADLGDVVCVDEYMEECQDKYALIFTELIKNKIFPIGIGGGHDIAYATFKGIKDALGEVEKKIGIINFDAHFDLRPVVEKPNSGTPFNQIINECKESKLSVDYFPIGIQKQANSPELYAVAEQEGVAFVDYLHCYTTQVKKQLDCFIKNSDYIYISIDMDGFSSAYASGVSAPSPLGLTPDFVIEIIRYILESNKVIACDIAEMNPKYDVDNQTATLAARLIDYICVL